MQQQQQPASKGQAHDSNYRHHLILDSTVNDLIADVFSTEAESKRLVASLNDLNNDRSASQSLAWSDSAFELDPDHLPPDSILIPTALQCLDDLSCPQDAICKQHLCQRVFTIHDKDKNEHNTGDSKTSEQNHSVENIITLPKHDETHLSEPESHNGPSFIDTQSTSRAESLVDPRSKQFNNIDSSTTTQASILPSTLALQSTIPTNTQSTESIESIESIGSTEPISPSPSTPSSTTTTTTLPTHEFHDTSYSTLYESTFQSSAVALPETLLTKAADTKSIASSEQKESSQEPIQHDVLEYEDSAQTQTQAQHANQHFTIQSSSPLNVHSLALYSSEKLFSKQSMLILSALLFFLIAVLIIITSMRRWRKAHHQLKETQTQTPLCPPEYTTKNITNTNDQPNNHCSALVDQQV